MNLIVITAFIAVCGAAKLDRTYLPPSSADSAGGSPGSLQAPLTRSSEQASIGLPTGSYTNDFGGVVVDAAAPGTRTSGDGSQSGLGAARPSYGSTDSKVGDAAFRGSVAGFRGTPSFGAGPTQSKNEHSTSFSQQNSPGATSFTLNSEIDTHAGHGFPSNRPEINGQFGQSGQFNSQFQGFDENKSERPQAAKDRNSNILTLSNDVNPNSYSYGFETDNGIAVGENGVAVNGVQAEGGYSYQGDDGQVYKVTYTADEGGYRPQGAHLPTPPPIPEDILKSLEQNAKEEAAGIVDDGSYDAEKYNTDGDYTHDNSGSAQHNGAQFGKRPESNTPIGAFNQNSQAYGKPGAQFGARPNAQNTQGFIGQSTQVGNTGSAPFGVASNGQNGQLNGKPDTEPSGFTGSQPGYNAQSTQVNNRPGSASFGSGSQSTHSTFEQSTHGNQFNPNPAITQNVNSGSQGSHSSQPIDGHASSAFGQNTFPTTLDHAPGTSGTQAQFGYQYGQQTSSSAQFQSQSAESSPQQNQQGFNTQFDSRLSTPSFSQGSQQTTASAQFESQLPGSSSQENHQGFNAQFGSKPSTPSFSQGTGNMQSAQPQFGSSFKPQGSEAFSGASLNQDQDNQDFGKPSPQTFTGQNFNRPAVGNYNKPSFGQGQTNKRPSTANGFNRFPQATSQLGAVNDNLSSFNSNGQPQLEKSTVSTPILPSHSGASGLNLNDQGPEKNHQMSDFVAPGKKPGFASAFASTSFGEAAFQRQPLNNFNTKPQTNPNQFTQQQTTQFSQQSNQLSSQTSTQFNANSQYSGQKMSDFISNPTMVPDTELATPLEPYKAPASQGSQLSSQTTSSFGPAINQASAQLGHEAFGQSTSQTTPSSFSANSPHFSSPFGTVSTQTGFQSSVGKRPDTTKGKPQFSENTFSQKQQSGYYYKKPSSISQSVLPQGSKFQSSQSYQSTAINSQNQQSFQGPTKLPGSPSFLPIGPTSSPQLTQTQGYSGITQAAISPFPSVSPTSSSQYTMNQNGQFGTQPSFNHQSSLGNHGQLQSSGAKPNYNQQPFGNQAQVAGNQGNAKLPTASSSRFPIRPISQINVNLGLQTQSESTPETSDSSAHQQTTQTQQHQGTVYEYNKPAEVLPVPSQTDSSSSQSIQTGFASESKPFFGQSQENQLLTTQTSKPAGSFGNQPFDNTPSSIQRPNSQSGQVSPTSQETAIQFGSQQAQPISTPSTTNIQFGQSTPAGVQPARPFGTTSTTHFGSSPLGSPSQGIQSSFETKPQFSGQNSQFGQNFGSSRPFQPESGSGSQSINNPGFSQDNGYVYPASPMPQFGEGSKNQFNLNSPSARPQSGGLNKFTQNTHSGYSQTTSFFKRPPSMFSSGSVPQFAQSQGIQNTQAASGQQAPNSPIQQLAQPGASSQVVASGQASATTSPQQSKPFGLQSTNQFGQKTDEKMQNLKPFDSDNAGSNEAPNSKPLGTSAQGSKPLFDSACCQASKDSTLAQSAIRPTQTSFQGTNLNIQGFAGKGEQFGGPRQPPSFDDQTGYHY